MCVCGGGGGGEGEVVVEAGGWADVTGMNGRG